MKELFATPNQRALQVAILPSIAQKLHEQARVRGVLLLESTHESNSALSAIN